MTGWGGNPYFINFWRLLWICETSEDMHALPAKRLLKQARSCTPTKGDVRESLVDISAVREVLGYEPAIAFPEGLLRSIEYYCAQGRSGELEDYGCAYGVVFIASAMPATSTGGAAYPMVLLEFLS